MTTLTEWECGSCGAIIDAEVIDVGDDYHDPDEDCRAIRVWTQADADHTAVATEDA